MQRNRKIYIERPRQTDNKHKETERGFQRPESKYRERQTLPEWLVRMQGRGRSISVPRTSRGSDCPSHLITEYLDLADGAVHQVLSA